MAALQLELDHLVVGTRSLEEGVAWLAERLGVTMPRGGRHVIMGTHNGVLALGGGVYLELIAIDPGAQAPKRPRWFDLDNPRMAAMLAPGPRLITWVVRTSDLSRLSGPQASSFGEHVSMSRDALRWLITVPADGRMPGEGFLPTLVQWRSEPPAATMPDSGCRLHRLTLYHGDAAWLDARLDELGAGTLVDVAAADTANARIEASITTPRGRVVLS